MDKNICVISLIMYTELLKFRIIQSKRTCEWFPQGFRTSGPYVDSKAAASRRPAWLIRPDKANSSPTVVVHHHCYTRQVSPGEQKGHVEIVFIELHSRNFVTKKLVPELLITSILVSMILKCARNFMPNTTGMLCSGLHQFTWQG